MPLSYLRRPLFILTILYMAALAGLRHFGWFEVAVEEDEARLRRRLPAVVEARVDSPLSENRLGERVYVEAEKAMGEAFRRRVLVYLPRNGPLNHFLRPGQVVEFTGVLRLPRKGRNPGDFDERAFLRDRGVAWIMKAWSMRLLEDGSPTQGPAPWGAQAIGPATGGAPAETTAPWGEMAAGEPAFNRAKAWFERLRARAEGVRRSMQDCLERRLPPEEARIMTGLCLGFKGPLERETNRAIQDAGVMHLLVPSGAKVAFVLLCAEWLLARWFFPAGRFLGAAVCGGFYTLMVGAEAPYARAFLAWAALRFSGLLGREPGMFQATALSALVILILKPMDLFAVGFQMTYLAVAGLVLAMPRVNAALPRSWPGWARASAQVLAVSVVVQVMLWPTFAAYFGRGALVGVLANILLVPASGFMMASGFGLWVLDAAGCGLRSVGDGLAGGILGDWLAASGLLGLAGDAIASPGSLVAGWIARLFVKSCFWFASFPCAATDLSPMGPVGTAVYYLIALGVLVLPRWRAGLALCLCGLLLWGATAAAGRLRGRTKVVFICLPKGRAALVEHPDGRNWLVDAGGPAGTVLRALKARGVSRLEKVVVTGFSPERWRGIGRILREVPVESAILPDGTPPARLSAALEEARGRGVRVAADPLAGAFRLWHGRICFDFSGETPAVRRGDAEYSIIGPRLKSRSLEVSSDGEKAEISGAL